MNTRTNIPGPAGSARRARPLAGRGAIAALLFAGLRAAAAAPSPDPIEGKWLGQAGFPQDRIDDSPLSHRHPPPSRGRPPGRRLPRSHRSRLRAGFLEPQPFHQCVPPRFRPHSFRMPAASNCEAAWRNEQEFESRHHRFDVNSHRFSADRVERDRKNLRMKIKVKKCPVCGWEITNGGKIVKVSGKSVVVCCDDCGEKVKANPAKYLKG